MANVTLDVQDQVINCNLSYLNEIAKPDGNRYTNIDQFMGKKPLKVQTFTDLNENENIFMTSEDGKYIVLKPKVLDGKIIIDYNSPLTPSEKYKLGLISIEEYDKIILNMCKISNNFIEEQYKIYMNLKKELEG